MKKILIVASLVLVALCLNPEHSIQVESSLLTIKQVSMLVEDRILYLSSNAVDLVEPPTIYYLANKTKLPLPKLSSEEIVYMHETQQFIYYGDTNSSVSRYSVITGEVMHKQTTTPLHVQVLGMISLPYQ